jgi:lipopolysaccharide export system permease protein
MKILDRQMLIAYLKAYAICFVSLLSLYIVIDLFTNIEDFTQAKQGFLAVAKHIGTYYLYRSSKIFDLLSEAIVLLAAMFTVAWMQRNNELLPLISAGISTQRVVRPVVYSACLMLGLAVFNQEMIIPVIAHHLMHERADDTGEQDVVQPWAYAPNGIHIEGAVASRKTHSVHLFCVTIPENIADGLIHLIAQDALYVPPKEGEHFSGGWMMTNTKPAQVDKLDTSKLHDTLEMIDPGKYFLRVQDVDFATITRPRNWYVLTSTSQLYNEMEKSDSLRLSAMAVLFHMRLTRPVIGMLLVMLGLSVILRDQNRNVFISAGMCLIISVLVLVATMFCKYLGDQDVVPPVVAAWLPVLFFGPLAFVLFDAIHT